MFEVRREGKKVICDEGVYGCLYLAALGAQSALGSGEHSWAEMKGALLSEDGLSDLEIVLQDGWSVACEIALSTEEEVNE